MRTACLQTLLSSDALPASVLPSPSVACMLCLVPSGHSRHVGLGLLLAAIPTILYSQWAGMGRPEKDFPHLYTTTTADKPLPAPTLLPPGRKGRKEAGMKLMKQ